MLERRVAPLRRVVVLRRRLALTPPVAVPVPENAREIDVAEESRLDDAVVRGLVHRVVVALIADLQDLPILQRRLPHAFAARDVPRHHLLAQHVLARVEAPAHDVSVGPEGDRHDDALDVFVGDHVLPVRVVFRGRASLLLQHLVGLRELRRVDVGHRGHGRVGGIDLCEQHAPLASDADEADPHRTAAHGPADGRGGAKAGERGHSGDGLQEVASADRLLFRREVHSSSTRAPR